MAQEQVAKLKKKQWYNIIAPKQFDNAVIGETLVYEPGAMLGKTLSHSLMNLTNDTKRQNINIHFKVVEIDGDSHSTEAERAHDVARTACLTHRGFTVLRFTNVDVYESPEGVFDALCKVLGTPT